MKRGLFFLISLFLTACQAEIPSAPPSQATPLKVQDLSVEDHLVQILDRQHFFDQISSNVGWIDHEHPYYTSDGVRELVMFDLEAEDEHRTLVVIFQQQKPLTATIIGYAPIESCSEDEPTRTETDGYVFVYDLSQGVRCLMNYFDGNQLMSSEEIISNQGHNLDLLSHEVQRQCLKSYLQQKPRGLNCHLLTELDMLPRMQYVADDISQILGCLK